VDIRADIAATRAELDELLRADARDASAVATALSITRLELQQDAATAVATSAASRPLPELDDQALAEAAEGGGPAHPVTTVAAGLPLAGGARRASRDAGEKLGGAAGAPSAPRPMWNRQVAGKGTFRAMSLRERTAVAELDRTSAPVVAAAASAAGRVTRPPAAPAGGAGTGMGQALTPTLAASRRQTAEPETALNAVPMAMVRAEPAERSSSPARGVGGPGRLLPALLTSQARVSASGGGSSSLAGPLSPMRQRQYGSSSGVPEPPSGGQNLTADFGSPGGGRELQHGGGDAATAGSTARALLSPQRLGLLHLPSPASTPAREFNLHRFANAGAAACMGASPVATAPPSTKVSSDGRTGIACPVVEEHATVSPRPPGPVPPMRGETRLLASGTLDGHTRLPDSSSSATARKEQSHPQQQQQQQQHLPPLTHRAPVPRRPSQPALPHPSSQGDGGSGGGGGSGGNPGSSGPAARGEVNVVEGSGVRAGADAARTWGAGARACMEEAAARHTRMGDLRDQHDKQASARQCEVGQGVGRGWLVELPLCLCIALEVRDSGMRGRTGFRHLKL
jgi:hypothetical protein